MQRAVCRASTGVPLGELASDPDVIQAFGGTGAVAALPLVPPKLITLIAGIRTAKSLFAAAKVFRATQVCSLDRLGSGEIARISLVSVRLDQATAVWDHLLGALQASKKLASVVAKWPANGSMFLWHPSGRVVEVKLVAGARAGATLIARWSAGVVFDEAPRMLGQEDGIINLDDALSAIRGRMLDGAQIDLIGSPWAPRGPVYNRFVDHFGKPTTDCIVVVAPGPVMHPQRFTPEFCAELELADPRAYKTDVLAQFADPEDALLSSVDVLACTRAAPEELQPKRENSYSAGIDPATRGNGWTLTIVTSDAAGCYSVAVARQWKGSHSRPLKPGAVLAEIATICKLYRIDSVASDQWSFDSLQELADQAGLTLREVSLNAETWRNIAENLRVLVSSRKLELPPNPTLRADLLGVQRRLTAQSWSPALASTAGDNRHSDYVPSLGLALMFPPEPPDLSEPEVDDDETRWCAEMRRRAENPLGLGEARWS